MKKTGYLLVIITALFSLSSCFKDAINESLGYLNEEASIYQLREVWKGDEIQLNTELLGGARYTSGVVVSNHENGNFPSNKIAIESSWRGQIRGVLLDVQNPENYSFGDSLYIEIDGAKLRKSQEGLTITDLASQAIQKLSSRKEKRHRAVSVGELSRNFDKYESTLINVTANVDDIVSGASIEGTYTLSEGKEEKVKLFTSSNAVFKDVKIAPNATFNGVALRHDNESAIFLQKEKDMENPSGVLYPGWPETFDERTIPKGSYNMPEIDNTTEFLTGEWYMYYAILGTTLGRDRIVSGERAVRIQQNRSQDSYLEMKFDVENGASKVTFWYGAYYNDRSSTFQLEYSVDQGNTWEVIGEPISDAENVSQNKNEKQAVFLMDIQQPVRFRINKLGLGTSSPTVSNGRLGIDDFAIYESY